jgi:hypothetical protein
VRGRRVQIAERTLADLLEPLRKALPEKTLDDFHLVGAPERRRLPRLTVTDSGCAA